MLAYHLGARSAGAQAAGTIGNVLEHGAAANDGGLVVVTQGGDCYIAPLDEFHGVISGQPRPRGSFWSGAKAARDSAIAQIKAKHR